MMERGHGKDHRPDLAQLKLMTIAAHPFGQLVATEVVSGNTVDVKRRGSINIKGIDLVEVFGDLSPGDVIAVRGTDDLRAGTKVTIKQPPGGK